MPRPKRARRSAKRAPILKTIRLGKIPLKAFNDFLAQRLRPRGGRVPRMQPAGGICGEWGCPLYYRGRRIKGCYRMIMADGTVRTVCRY